MVEGNEKIEQLLLLNHPIPYKGLSVLESAKKILDGQYKDVLENESLMSEAMEGEDFEKVISSSNLSTNELESLFLTGIAALLYFVQNNWTGPFQEGENDVFHSFREIASRKLLLSDQLNENSSKPELLYLSKIIFKHFKIQSIYPTSKWWLFRANYLHQMILDEASAILFAETENIVKEVKELPILCESALSTIFNIEVVLFYLCYRRIQSSETYLDQAQSVAKLQLELSGALGKRTKYQQQDKAQLYLTTSVGKDLFSYRKCELLPKVINLSDELRLEKIEFTEEKEMNELGSIEEAIVMAKFFQLQSSQPKDELIHEELLPYLEIIIDNSVNWPLKMSALHQRCVLESNHKRTVERAMAQVEYLIEQLNSPRTPVSYKMDLFFTSGMKPVWYFRQNLADLMLNLGMIKGALDIYLNLSLWEDVIVCYTILEMKAKAAEIIKQELSKKETVKLWCLLGDATQDVQNYEIAWKLSGEKSSRAQRHWGLFYYSKQNYAEAIPHLKLSVELNNIQENVWVRLGFAALQVEDWKLAASAYRKYCSLEQSSFEVWNNLAKAYIKLGDKARAWHSLQDAVKCNFDKWEVWDNLMVVSLDLGNFSEVIRCYHRILDLKGSHVDAEILSILSKAIIDELHDSDGNSSRKYLSKALELFGRITATLSTNSDVWRLYAELTLLKNNELDNQKAIQYLQRAYRAAVSNPRWFKTVESASEVMDTCARLSQATISCLNGCSTTQKRTVLGSAKLSLQSVIKKMNDPMWKDHAEIVKKSSCVEEQLHLILEELQKLEAAGD
ncbi:hypothetical protein QAD02_022168 [Eretmocerus hayati]|uniref:Uncharacterized protein n=1 Tax=Eretmocerus hayati TaxID=131215 RepID=A0ACC2PUQ6_9HYME|nr:hypothetical protein QAD02_022168 [Eretmocerus hayati]